MERNGSSNDSFIGLVKGNLLEKGIIYGLVGWVLQFFMGFWMSLSVSLILPFFLADFFLALCSKLLLGGILG